jgi:hypothetical protein
MYPHERSLVTRLQGKPFALLGINERDQKETLKQLVAKGEITWRFWWDGPHGPIAKQWRIEYTPTIYVLDPKGVIRYKDVRDQQMDKAVDTLLREAGNDKTS